jgi:hypothetical protein
MLWGNQVVYKYRYLAVTMAAASVAGGIVEQRISKAGNDQGCNDRALHMQDTAEQMGGQLFLDPNVCSTF